MSRIRTVKPEFWEDETVGTLSREARLLFLATLNLADDEGLLRWNAEFLKASAFIYDSDITGIMVSGYMAELVSSELIFPYVAGRVRQDLAWIVMFRRHQKINKPQPGKLPPPNIQNLDVKSIYAKRDRWSCHLCHKTIPNPSTHDNRALMLSLDHILPQIQGGTDYPSNLACAHSGCNSARGERPIADFKEPFSLKAMNDSGNDSGNSSRTGSPTEGKGREREGNRKGNGGSSATDGEVISTIKLEPPKPSALRAARASRIPEDFIPQEDHYLLAKELGLNCEMEFQKFRDHFLGAPGQRGLKLDWDATLRNWLRTSFDRGGSNGQQQVGKAAARAIDNRANILAGLGIGPLTGPSGAGVPSRSPAGGSPRLVGDVQD